MLMLLPCNLRGRPCPEGPSRPCRASSAQRALGASTGFDWEVALQIISVPPFASSLPQVSFWGWG